MSVVEEIANITGAVSGVLGAVIGVIAAQRQGYLNLRRPVVRRARDSGAVRVPLVVRDARRAVFFGMVCLVLAAILIVVLGTTTRQGSTLVSLLRYGIGAPVALAVFFGVRGLHGAFTPREPQLLMYCGAGLIAALGAMIAALITG